MIRNWLGTNEKPAKFSYKIRTKCCDPVNCDLDMTNNLIELFHKNIYSKFSSKPNLKRFIEILQDIEEDFLAKKQSIENTIESLPGSNQSKHRNTCHYEQPAKKRRTQYPDNKNSFNLIMSNYDTSTHAKQYITTIFSSTLIVQSYSSAFTTFSTYSNTRAAERSDI
jgi:hypothetical protein